MIIRGLSVKKVEPVDSVQVREAAHSSPGIIRDYLRSTSPYKPLAEVKETIKKIEELGVEKRLAVILASYTYPRSIKGEEIALISNSLGEKLSVGKTEKIIAVLTESNSN